MRVTLCGEDSYDNRQKLLHTRVRAASDMETTIAFYRDVLGLEVLERKVLPCGSHLAFLAVPHSDELIERCRFPASGLVSVQDDLIHLVFEIEDLDQAMDQLKAKHGPITDGPTRTSSGSWFIFIDAQDGYEVELIERAPGTVIA